MKRLYLSAAMLAAAGVIHAEGTGPHLEELVVTAQKKAELLQDTPISMAAFGEENLEKNGVANLEDLSSSVPSMAVEPYPTNNSTLRIYIRGVGLTDAQVTQDAPVGIYIDGVYVARSTGLAMDVADLERIEVLRGPQGTLYGRNSTGGAVNLITKRPSTDGLHIKQKLSAGNLGYRSSKTSINLPLTDKLAAKLAYLYTKKDGFIKNDGPGGDFGQKQAKGWRADVHWDISDDVQLDYSYDHSSAELYNQSYQPITPRPYNTAGDINAAMQNFAANKVTFQDGRWSRATTAAELLPSKTAISGHSLTLSWDVSDALQIKYIGAYRKLDSKEYYDFSGGGGFADYRLDSNSYTTLDGSTTYPASITHLKQSQVSHELQFNGSFLDDEFEYTSGLYYFSEHARSTTPFGHQLNVPINETTVAPGVVATSSLLALVGNEFVVDNTAAAVYGRLTWTPPVLDDRLHLTLGARHSEDKRKAEKSQHNATYIETVTTSPLGTTALAPTLAANSQFNAAGDRSYRDNSLEFISAFDLDQDTNIYLKYVEAYKSGGFNVRDPDEARFKAGFDPEKVASVEFGVKSELMNRRLRVNADVFRSRYTDMQLNFLLPNSISDTEVVNAGAAEMKGLELDVTFAATENLLLSLNYAYLDAKITSAKDPNTGADAKDAFTFAEAPRNSYTAAADYTVANWDWGRLVFNLSYNYMDERKGSARTASTPYTWLNAYHLLNARLGLYELPVLDGAVDIALWGKNLQDTDYPITATDNQLTASRAVTWGEPRSFGIDLTYRY